MSQNQFPEWFELIKTSKPDYEEMYRKMQARKSEISFNWGAALFGSLWFAYRRMYLEMIACILIDFLSSVVYLAINSNAINLILILIYGIIGNKLYFNFLKRLHVKGVRYNEKYKDTNIFLPLMLIFVPFLFSIIYYFNFDNA